MAQIATASLPSIQAALNYLATAGEKPVTYAYQPPPGVPWSTAKPDERATVIHNLRPAASELLLDDVGFQFLTHASAVKNFWDEDEIRRVYYPKSVALLKRVTGAAEVRVFDHTLRRRVPGENDRSTTPGVPRQPANRVHVDQTATSGESRLRINIRMKPTHCFAVASPSSICGGRSNRRSGRAARRVRPRSVAPQDLVASDLIFRDRRGETYNLIYGPGQRWFYAPEMRADEVLLLKCYNSRDDGAVARFAPHTAFIDPTAPQDAPPRESIELRAFVIFAEDEKARH